MRLILAWRLNLSTSLTLYQTLPYLSTSVLARDIELLCVV